MGEGDLQGASLTSRQHREIYGVEIKPAVARSDGAKNIGEIILSKVQLTINSGGHSIIISQNRDEMLTMLCISFHMKIFGVCVAFFKISDTSTLPQSGSLQGCKSKTSAFQERAQSLLALRKVPRFSSQIKTKYDFIGNLEEQSKMALLLLPPTSQGLGCSRKLGIKSVKSITG